MTEQSTQEELPAPSPGQLALLAIPALLIGVITALVLWTLDVVSGALEDVLWTTLPDALGVDPNGWWIIVVLTTVGLVIGVCLQFLPGHGGPDSATTELVEPPLPLKTLPGLLLVTLLALAGGVSLGPENPIIAVNVALTVALLARFMPRVTGQLAMLMAASGTIGALFGTPVAAALLFTGIVAGVRGGGALWDKLFIPLASAAAGATTMHLLGAPPLAFTVPAGTVDPIDLPLGILVACLSVVIGLIGAYALPWVHRAFHALRSPILIAGLGGLVLGILGFIGGPITMFKGLEQMGELLEHPADYSAGDLAVIVAVKLVALLVAASAAFRGGRVFPSAFIGVAFGLLAVALIPELPMGLGVACGVLGILLVVTRDGWLSLFVAVAVTGDLAVLPWMCVIVLPAWLLVTRAPEFRIVPKVPPAESTPKPATSA
jgi:chloride channel protein, CIC family